MTHKNEILLGLVIVACVGTGRAEAQSLNGVLNQMMNAAQQAEQKQAAADAWSRTDPAVVNCVQRVSPVNGFVQRGIGPNDPRVAALVSRCAQSVSNQRQQEQQRLQAQAQAEAQRQREAEERKEAEAKAEARRKQEADQLTALRVNTALRQVMGSDPHDITILVVGHDTAHVIRNLKGEPTFQNGVSLCEPFGPLGRRASTHDETKFLAASSASLIEQGGGRLYRTNCGAAEIKNSELIAFSTAQIADASLGPLSALVDAINSKQLVKFAVFRFSDFQAKEKAIREDFLQRNSGAISEISISVPAMATCIGGDSSTEALQYLLKRSDSPFVSVTPPQSNLRQEPSPDAMFVALKRHDCTAAVASTGVLKQVTAALARDNVEFEIFSGSLSAERLTEWKTLKADEQLARAAGVAETQRTSSEAAKPLAQQASTRSSSPEPVQQNSIDALPRCDQSPVAVDYYVAACVVRGMALAHQQQSFASAQAKAESERQKLQCSADSLNRVGQSANLSAAKILSSGKISKLMDFQEAITAECGKEAALVLKQ